MSDALNLNLAIKAAGTITAVEQLTDSLDLAVVREMVSGRRPGDGIFLSEEEAEFTSRRIKLFLFYAEQRAELEKTRPKRSVIILGGK